MRLSLFLEKKGEKAHRDAVAMGLQYKGFGYWADPQTGEAKYKTVDDQLVPVEGDVESDMYKGDKEGDAPFAAGPGGQMAVPGGAAAGAPMAPPVGTGLNIGPATGQAQRPAEKKGWDAGPDGDTCVDGQPTEEMPQDMFVGKGNSNKWTAGPDGDNAMELGEMRQLIGEAEFNPDRQQHVVNVNRAVKNGLGKFPEAGTETRRDADLGVRMGSKWLKKYLARVAGRPEPPTGTTQFTPTIPTEPSKTPGGHPVSGQYYTPSSLPYDGDEVPEPPSWMGGGTSKVQDTDEENVRGLNDSARRMVTDYDFDLDQYDDREPLAAGAFGSFTLGDDGVGVKTGNIGPGELAALYAMRDNPHFPTLINARFEGPFKNQAAAYNNPGDNSNMRRRSDGNYFDPKTAQSWDKRFPGAWGKYAMSVAGGEPLGAVWGQLSPEIKKKAMKSFWEARGELHSAGFSHNDMHSGNIFVNPKTGEVSILDLGLAEENPLTALMEATGGFDFEEGQDYQLAHHLSGSNIPEELRERMTERLGGLEESILDMYGGDMEDEEGFDEAMGVGGEVMRGNIRMDKENMERILKFFPGLNDPEKVLPLISKMYEGLTDGFGETSPMTSTGSKGKPGTTTRIDNLAKQGVGTSGLAKIRKILDMDD